MRNDPQPKLFLTDGSPVDSLAITDKTAHDSRVIAFGSEGYTNGLVAIDNGLDQTVVVTVYGRHERGGANSCAWQSVDSASVASGAADSIAITAPWGLIKVRAQCGSTPSSGTVVISLSRVTGGAPGTGSISGNVTVVQPAHDNLNANANMQVGDTDVANGNPVPVSDAGGSLTVDVSGTVDVSDRAARDLGKVDIAAFDVALPTGANNIGDVDVLTIAAGETHIGEVGSPGGTISLTPTITAGAYSAGDAVGGLLTFANAARVAGGGGVIKGVLIIDDAGQDAELELWLFNQTFTAMADNAAWAPSEADLENWIGTISTEESTNGWLAAGTPSTIDIEVSRRYDLTGTSIFGQLVNPSDTPTYVATDDLTVKICLLQD